MPKVFDYLKQAPKVRGFRILRPDEKARRGDRFTYLSISMSIDPETGSSTVTDSGFIRVGRTLKQARKESLESYNDFDGVIYRPLMP